MLFEKTINGIARKVLLKGHESYVTKDVLQRFDDLRFYLSEILLRHDVVCISVYGENLPACLMLRMFGYDGLLKLLEQRAIKFHLQDKIITFIKADVKGVSPLQSGKLTSSVHVDPEASVEDGLKRSTINLDRTNRRKLTRKLVKAYVNPIADYAPSAVKFAHDGYTLNQFESFGLQVFEPISELSNAKRERLCKLATEIHDLALLSNLHAETLDSFEITQVCGESFKKIENARKLQEAYCRVFDIEGIPNYFELLKSGLLPVEAVPDHRMTKDCRKIREWFNQIIEKEDSPNYSREYIDAITSGGLFGSKKARFIKTLTVSGLFMGIGAAVGGPAGMSAGGVLSKVAEPVVDVGLNLFDEFILSNVLSGWRPKNYFDKLRKKIS